MQFRSWQPKLLAKVDCDPNSKTVFRMTQCFLWVWKLGAATSSGEYSNVTNVWAAALRKDVMTSQTRLCRNRSDDVTNHLPEKDSIYVFWRKARWRINSELNGGTRAKSTASAIPRSRSWKCDTQGVSLSSPTQQFLMSSKGGHEFLGTHCWLKSKQSSRVSTVEIFVLHHPSPETHIQNPTATPCDRQRTMGEHTKTKPMSKLGRKQNRCRTHENKTDGDNKTDGNKTNKTKQMSKLRFSPAECREQRDTTALSGLVPIRLGASGQRKS